MAENLRGAGAAVLLESASWPEGDSLMLNQPLEPIRPPRILTAALRPCARSSRWALALVSALVPAGCAGADPEQAGRDEAAPGETGPEEAETSARADAGEAALPPRSAPGSGAFAPPANRALIPSPSPMSAPGGARAPSGDALTVCWEPSAAEPQFDALRRSVLASIATHVTRSIALGLQVAESCDDVPDSSRGLRAAFDATGATRGTPYAGPGRPPRLLLGGDALEPAADGALLAAVLAALGVRGGVTRDGPAFVPTPEAQVQLVERFGEKARGRIVSEDGRCLQLGTRSVSDPTAPVPVHVASCASGPQPNGAFHEVWTYDGERRLLTPYRRFGALDTDGGEARRGTALLSQDAASAVTRWNLGSVSWVGLGGLCLAPTSSGTVELTTCERARWSLRPAPREAGPARYVLATRHAGREQCLNAGEGGSLRLARCEATATQQHFAWLGRQLVASSNACVAAVDARPTRGAPVTLGSCDAAAGRATLATHWHLRGPLRTESRSCVAESTDGDLVLAACGRARTWDFHL